MLYNVLQNGIKIGAVYLAWPLPKGQVCPVQGENLYFTLATTKISEFRYQAYGL